MGEPAREHQTSDAADVSNTDPEQFLRDFRRRMAEQGMIVRMANPRPDWEPPITLDVSANELSEMVVRLRRGEA
jgi:hypothetical protein